MAFLYPISNITENTVIQVANKSNPAIIFQLLFYAPALN